MSHTDEEGEMQETGQIDNLPKTKNAVTARSRSFAQSLKARKSRTRVHGEQSTTVTLINSAINHGDFN